MIIFSNLKNFLKNHIFSRFTTKLGIILVTVLSVVSLLYQYFSREDSVSVYMVAGAVIVPFQEGVNEIGSFLFKTEKERVSLSEAKEEIERLSAENEELKRKLSDTEYLSVENSELRGLLSAKERLSDYEMLEASVIGNDGVNTFERFTVDRGLIDGISVDMNVINADGLVGVVTAVGLNYSIVTAIIEDGMNVSAMTRNGHENCIVTGDLSVSGKETLLLSNALSEIDFDADGTLVTSNISDKFLPGILIGYVDEVEVNNGELTKSGTVKTAVDFSRITEVMIITTMKEELKEAED